MTVEDVREYEAKMHSETNEKVRQAQLRVQQSSTAGEDDVFTASNNDNTKLKENKTEKSEDDADEEGEEEKEGKGPIPDGLVTAEPSVVTSLKSWFSWS